MDVVYTSHFGVKINFVITREHVKRHKPDPEAFILALKHFSLSNAEVLIFEDSNAGLIATNRAGCDVVAVSIF